MYKDKTLVCKDCGQEFTFTASEQEFFAEKGFTNEPQRCKACRNARKGSASSNKGLPTNSECRHSYPGVRRWVLRSSAERGTTQTTGQGPQVAAKLEKRGAVAETARRFAWKQQFLYRVRNSSLVERPCMDNKRASSRPPKPWDIYIGRGAFQVRRIGPARARGAPGKANVGMSNDNPCQKQGHRKAKVS